MSSVGLGLSGACVLLGGLRKERALPGLLACVLMDGSAAAVSAALLCRASRSALMPWTSSVAAVMSSLDACNVYTHQLVAITNGMHLPACKVCQLCSATFATCQHNVVCPVMSARHVHPNWLSRSARME